VPVGCVSIEFCGCYYIDRGVEEEKGGDGEWEEEGWDGCRHSFSGVFFCYNYFFVCRMMMLDSFSNEVDR